MNKDGCKYFQNAFLGYVRYLKMATSYMSSKNMKFAVLYEVFKGILSDKIGLSQPSFSLQCIFKGFWAGGRCKMIRSFDFLYLETSIRITYQKDG